MTHPNSNVYFPAVSMYCSETIVFSKYAFSRNILANIWAHVLYEGYTYRQKKRMKQNKNLEKNLECKRHHYHKSPVFYTQNKGKNKKLNII